jgi:cyclic beta-1,2-glucan glucanotransferase
MAAGPAAVSPARLARRHERLSSSPVFELDKTLAAHERNLRHAYQVARAAAADKRRIEPAAEWLIDNFYLVRNQIREVRDVMPRRLWQRLPRTDEDDGATIPRMLQVLRACIAHVDGNVEPEPVERYIDDYQKHAALDLVELWALPALIRIALIEGVAAGAQTIGARLEEYARAGRWADYLIDVAQREPNDMLVCVADMARETVDISHAFAAEFHRLLEGKHPCLKLALTFAEQQLEQRGTSVGRVIEGESRSQAADQVSIANRINSLRRVAEFNWSELIERVSLVDRTLALDPAGAYERMDFSTRGHYRHAVESLARRSGLPETEVARRAIDAARVACAPDSDPRVRHVGHVLTAGGRAAFERALGIGAPTEQHIAARLRRWPATTYLGGIFAASLMITIVVMIGRRYGAPTPLPDQVLLWLATFVAASQPAVTLVNWLLGLLVPPQLLPRMSFSGGVPDECRTLVVVPWLLGSQLGLAEQLDALEIRYLGNRDANLRFALLTDFPDAPERDLPGDAALIESAIAGIDRLNARYPLPGSTHFYLFHRPREWNPRQSVWMGFERKRGKLGELNRVLRGGRPARGFSVIVGDLEALQCVRYVITLDADTQLPPEAARRLVETMAHPLNRPWFHKGSRRVVAGYGILQPRVSVSHGAERASRFARLFSDSTGLDPYTRAVSDVYQDLFGEASFVGKGIYDVDAFNRSVGTRFPNDLILSHDLLEGSYARTGLVSDIELLEQQPDRYSVETRRRHRWTRGDWQIVQWLLPIVPGPRRRGLRNTLKAHQRWKILDNLRRGLVPLAMMVVLLRGWLVPDLPAYWTLVVVAFLLGPPLVIALAQIMRNVWHRAQPRRWRNTLRGMRDELLRDLFALAVLPFETYLNVDAILRSAGRLLFTRRRLLEWTPMSDAERGAATRLSGYLRLMWTAPAVALVSAAALWSAPAALPAAAPLLALWLFAPWLAWMLSRAPEPGAPPLDGKQTAFLRRVSRRTWHWFETFVNPGENWLPPDNCQSFPVEQIAHRTSPTNIGMALLANLTAFDFGYLQGRRLLARTRAMLDTLDRLPRHRGHFYNWYHTLTLEPLRPKYVSTVDSGNLMGCLLVLANALEHGDTEPLVPRNLGAGLRDTVQLLNEGLPRIESADPHACLALTRTLNEMDALAVDAIENADALPLLHGLVARIAAEAARLEQLVVECGIGGEFAEWSGRLSHQCAEAGDELGELAPWLGLGDSGSDDEIARALLAELEGNPTRARAIALADEIVMRLEAPADGSAPAPDLCAALRELLITLRRRQDDGVTLARRCRDLALMDLEFLWDRDREQFVIGYDVDRDSRDSGRYDLLASEARLTSYLAIALGQVPPSHWFALGRLLTVAAGRPVLVSWSGSMFEYLMPLLLMPGYANTLLDDSCRAAIARQIRYGDQQQAPWGVSESAYNATDANLVYQYRAFGVPGLGLKRGLGDDFVVAPYASALALMLEPAAACRNLEALAALGALTRYGFHEALDYTAGRVSEGHDFAMVCCWMAHHHGMSLLALSTLLNGRPMQRRFMREPMFRTYELLLREKIPEARPRHPAPLDVEQPPHVRAGAQAQVREITRMDTPLPQTHLLSNGNYHVMLTQTGTGYSQWKQFALTRWRGDAARDSGGLSVYVRDLESRDAWSATCQPLGGTGANCSATFSQARAEFRRDDFDMATEVTVAVSAEDDIELRRVRLTNRSGKIRTIEVTTYAEVVLAPRDADAAHPAFSKLFLETEALPERDALLVVRRPRRPDEQTPWLLHLVTTRGGTVAPAGFETDRARFIGRLRDASRPRALDDGVVLTGATGAVLDPIVSLRRRVQIEPGHTASIDVITGVAPDRGAALAIVKKYRERTLHQRVFQLAWTHDQVVLQQLNMSAGDAQRYERIASMLLYGSLAAPRDAHGELIGQSALWKHGVSGDLPIVLVRIANASQIDLVRQLIQAHGYWHTRGLQVDLLIWNEELSGYRQELQEHILYLIESGAEVREGQGRGRMFAWRIEHLPAPDRALMLAIARCVFSGDAGRLRDQIARMEPPDGEAPARLAPPRKPQPGTYALEPPTGLGMHNGHGGFDGDRDEYVMWLRAGQATPAPWSNVLANPSFGSVVTESGGGYTWAENAHEFRLTPWYNDPITDQSGEALWLRDEDTGEFWSVTPMPTPSGDPHRVRHGFGYTCFEHAHADLTSELTQFVAREAPLKLSLLTLQNRGDRVRNVSVTTFLEWVLGERRERTGAHLRTRIDPDCGAMFVRNAFDDTFARYVAFHLLDAPQVAISADRQGFIGRNRNLATPLGMRLAKLQPAIGTGLDPCSVQRASFTLAPGASVEVVILLGAAASEEQARALVQELRDPEAARAELERVRARWRLPSRRLKVATPEPACDIMINGWLTYQVLASRFFGRSGYYQSGGAWGFRDQLQDAMALLNARPDIARTQLLRCAGRQFREGDVQHWWHPPSGKGVRTRISDDFLWLPWCTAEYVRVTGDATVLDELMPFIESRPLGDDEESIYEGPQLSSESANLYQHCLRAIRRGLHFGTHGLPLIGGGDWNDGMNRLGVAGRGESVWLGMFLYDVLERFAPLASARGDDATATHLRETAGELGSMIERHAWDGGWYLRAWNDDGIAIGSARSDECRIDSLPQSWSVLAGVGERERAERALDAVLEQLVDDSAGLVKLFTPPFDKTPLDPGYIKGYVPGVRENGGQYTHAAVWVAMAMAKVGRIDVAWRIARMLNPLSHTADAQALQRYRLEPYVMAGDVYAAGNHVGRGGWSWYTGSAGWMYRLLTETLLGLHREGSRLAFAPCVPEQWDRWSAVWRQGGASYRIEFVRRAPGKEVTRVVLDGVPQSGRSIELTDDGAEHVVLVQVGAPAPVPHPRRRDDHDVAAREGAP